jgi:hypothetical protein
VATPPNLGEAAATDILIAVPPVDMSAGPWRETIDDHGERGGRLPQAVHLPGQGRQPGPRGTGGHASSSSPRPTWSRRAASDIEPLERSFRAFLAIN